MMASSFFSFELSVGKNDDPISTLLSFLILYITELGTYTPQYK